MTKNEEVNKILNKHILIGIRNNIDYKALISDLVEWNDNKFKDSGINPCKFTVNEHVIAFNSVEWSKVGDTPDGNKRFWQKARILRLRYNDNWLADVEFECGLISNGHFVNGIESIS